VIDWNSDGLLDLLTGGSDGGVYLSLNRGTPATPDWSVFSTLIPPTNMARQIAGEPLVPGHSWRLWVFDWNFDGKLDLLVGDCVNLLYPRPGITENTFKDKAIELQVKAKQLKAIQQEARQLAIEKRPTVDFEARLSQLQQMTDRVQGEFQVLEANRFQWALEKQTGFVWLFLQK
jgi:hypothetical protein